EKQDIAFLGEPSQIAQRLGSQDHAGGVGRAVYQDDLGARRQGGADAVHVDLVVGVSIDEDRFAAGQRHQVRVHDEVRIEQDDFVAWIDGAEQGQDQAAAGAAGNDDLAVGVAKALVHVRFD